jgi:colanic acid biosynthesis glycosyl transferase WcaI
MKFLILTQYFPPEIGAAPTRLDAMARELVRTGHGVEVVTGMPNYPSGRISPDYRGSFYRREIRDGIIIHRVWLYPTVGSGFGRVLNYLSFSVFALYGLLRTGRPDYLFVESPPPTLSCPAYLYASFHRIPFLLNIADLWPDTLVEMGLLNKGIAFKLLSWLERWSYRKAAYVNAVTEGLRASLLREKGLPSQKVLFLPNGVDTERHRPCPPDAVLKGSLGLTGKKVVLYSGTLGRAHGLEYVLEAAKILEDERDIHFLFLGDGSERPELEKLQRHLGLRNVSFHDAVPLEQLAPYQSIADAGLVSLRNLPIFEGARPSKMFPILAAGKPLIFCGSGEGARLVRRANAGIVLPPENPKALAAAVPQLLRNAVLMQELGANGRRFMKENHEWGKLIGDWLRELRDAPSTAKTIGDRSNQEVFE